MWLSIALAILERALRKGKLIGNKDAAGKLLRLATDLVTKGVRCQYGKEGTLRDQHVCIPGAWPAQEHLLKRRLRFCQGCPVAERNKR